MQVLGIIHRYIMYKEYVLYLGQQKPKLFRETKPYNATVKCDTKTFFQCSSTF